MLKNSFAENVLGVLVDMLNKSQTRALPTKKVRVWGCIGSSTASRSSEMILSLYSALVKPHLKCWVLYWGAQNWRDMNYWRMSSKGAQR